MGRADHADIPVLYHGTSAEKARKILEEGLRDPCLTNDEDRAWYYAECCAEEKAGGSAAVIQVELDAPDSLVADITSIEEPVMAGGRSDQKIWDEATETTARLGVDGWEALPWDEALRIAGAVRHNGLIPPSQLEQVEF